MRIFFGTLIGIFITSLSFAQKDPQGWLIYFGQTKIKTSKFAIHHELQLRDHQLMGDHNQTLLRVGLQYQAKPYLWTTVGYGFIYNEQAGTPNRPFHENRIYQELLFSHKASRASIRHRVRLEERFIEDSDFSGRFRYCLFADIPFTPHGMGAKGWYAAMYDEIFLNLSNDDDMRVFDRNRAYLGLGYKISDSLGIQLGYMYQNVGSAKGTNHALLSVHHQVKWK
ncbi:DUF2490 domain-containing protein [Sphingobacterium corticibacterium]|uniref:DUF2490 domain-containing protein n=1 Tax=Sphingobacterium corticibacterium TaxID=2484746 RepID=A0A4Q6XRN2_9SPHI|nr:DUF2490 domain-containing protein [Sphingobacterium corticibacterium]RZF62601.1 DUF2490 domain-containing protein [Sphingobacterium corticibacterium]